MPPLQHSRQQRRKLRRGLVERGRKALRLGLPAPLTDDDALGIALALRETIGDAANPRSASAMAGEAQYMLDRTIASQTRGMPIACAKGCNYCCHCLVVVTAPEVFRIADWLRQRAAAQSHASEMVARASAEAERRRPLSVQDRFQEAALCSLNVEGACGIYEVRPVACRSLLSLSAEACRIGIMEGRGQVPIVEWAMDATEAVRTLMLAAVRSLGLPDAGCELNAGVSAALAQPDAERRWLAGEDVFFGVPMGPRMPEARAIQDRIAAGVTALIE